MRSEERDLTLILRNRNDQLIALAHKYREKETALLLVCDELCEQAEREARAAGEWPPEHPAAHTPPRRRLLVMATVEIPTDRDWTTDRMQRDVEGALTDYGYFVVRAAVEPIKENV